MKTLLYVGAGWDAFPITIKHIREDHDIILYVDALPSTPHYSEGQRGYLPSLSKQMIIGQLISEGGFDATIGAPVYTPTHVQIPLKDNVMLNYFFNTKDIDLNQNAEISGLLPSVVTMWQAGFSPDQSVYEMLPNLETIYSTQLCAYNIPVSSQHKIEIVPDIIEYLDGEFIFHSDTESDSEPETDSDSVSYCSSCASNQFHFDFEKTVGSV